MDDGIKQILISYETALSVYKKTLGQSHPLIQRADSIYTALYKKAESAHDATAFYADKEVSILMAEIGSLLIEIAKEKVDSPQPFVSVTQVAASYHIGYEQLPVQMKQTRALYEKIFEIELMLPYRWGLVYTVQPSHSLMVIKNLCRNRLNCCKVKICL